MSSLGSAGRTDGGSGPGHDRALPYQLSRWEIGCTIAMFYSSALVTAPIRIFNVAGYSGWLAGVIGGAIAVGITLAWAAAALRWRDKTPPEYIREVAGPFFGWIINFGLWTYFVSEVAVNARFVGEAFVRLMPETPLVVFVAMTALFTAVLARIGPEALGRVSGIHIAIVTLSFLFVFASVGRRIQPIAFLPFLESGWGPVLNGSLTHAAFAGEGAVVALLLPYLRRPDVNGRQVMTTALGGSLFLFACTQSMLALEQGVIGAPEASRLELPALTLVRTIEYGAFVERVESALVGVWMPAIMIKASAFTYAAAHVSREVFGVLSHRIVTLPIAAMSAAVGVWLADDVIALIRLVNGSWAVYALFWQVVPIAVVLSLAAARKRRRGA